MQLQAVTIYAIRIIQHLHTSTDKMQAGTEIANTLGLTYPVFMRVAMRLRQESFLVSAKGRTGGYMLGKAAEDISFYDVFYCMQGEPSFHKDLGNGNAKNETEKLNHFLQGVQNDMVSNMSKISILDLI